MNDEQKHQEDLESAKGWLAIAKENNNKIAIQILEKFFPELKESEDERIRKELIAFLERKQLIPTETKNEWIAWLEKQAEQKPYPETLDKAIELYYYSYGNGKGGFDKLSLENFKDIIKTFVEDYGNKSSWSEEDDYILNLASKFISKGYKSHPKIPSLEFIQDWLNSFKDRVQPQPKQEWSEEDEKMLERVIDSMKFYLSDAISNKSKEVERLVKEEINWLKSIKPQQNQYDKGYNDGYSAAKYNNWKPSEVQMEAIKDFIEAVETSNYAQLYLQWLTGLKSLYNDLKNFES